MRDEGKFVIHSGLRQRSAVAPGDANDSVHRVHRFPRWLAWTAGVARVLLAVGAAVVAYVIHDAEPILRQRVIASLEERFRAPVELDALHISLLRGLEASGTGLRVFPVEEPNQPDAHPAGAKPMLSVERFEFRTGLRELFEPTMRVGTVRVDGMRLDILPKQSGGPLTPRAKLPAKLRLSIAMDTILCRDVTLTIETNKPGNAPLVFAIHEVTLDDVGPGRAFPFEASLANPKPVGEIHSTGRFGPWQPDYPRDTPVDGSYSFTNADLATIKGISGTLSSTGRYSGTLGEIGVVGTTDTPDFALDVSEHPVDLRTQFDATVDGTTGDTRLNSVRATLLHTVLQANGMVMRASDMPGGRENVSGHFIDISVESSQARAEDLLRLGARTSPPLMQGEMTLSARLSIPPGHASLTRKMRVQGTFTIRGATFNNPQWQETVNQMSARASGDPEQATAADAARVASRMSGNFALANAMLDVSRLNYQMPGAQVDLTGKYGLDGETFDFAGTVRTKATASEMLTGWKSILAMPFDRFFKKNGAGLEVPIKISGTKSKLNLGLDLDKLFPRPKDTAPGGRQAPPRQ
jgi:hypothetical protein